MRVLHAALEDALRAVPEKVLAKLVVAKLAAQGIALSPSELARLQKRIVNKESGPLTIVRWRWWEQQEIVVEFTEDDTQEIEQRFGEFTDRIPRIIGDLSNELASSILATLRRRWASVRRRQKREQAGFEHRLLRRWGPALGQLEMLLTISREFGASVDEELRESATASPHRLEVLTRLHARACQVVHEIWVLLAAGLADGAMARWRTLHEIAAIALFVGEHGEDLAERYILHEQVESVRAARDYATCQERLGYEPLEPGERDDLHRSCDSLLARFGRPYGTSYGWAAAELGVDKPKVWHIEQAAGIDHLRAHYRMASHNVHANPKGVFFKLGLLEEVDLLLCGPSNAGLADPGHSAAISLVQASTPLALLQPTLDNIVVLEIMLLLVDGIGQAFRDAHQQLAQDSA